MLAYLVVGIFACWLALSLLVYSARLKEPIRYWDVFSLVPEWKFFAPTPAQGDYHLLYRDVLGDGSVTQWTELAIAEPRAWWNFAWNPSRRPRKALFDVTVELAMHLLNQPNLPLEGSIPYLTLLQYVSAIPRPFSPPFTQFIVIYSHGTQSSTKPDVLFASGLHAL